MPNSKLKVLTMCQQGNTRSHALAYWLRDHYGCHSIAIGWNSSGEEAQSLLYAWADKIVVMEPYMLDKVPDVWHFKTLICNVGPDRWFRQPAEELSSLCRSFIENCLLKGERNVQ